jgi:transmembrane sensor
MNYNKYHTVEDFVLDHKFRKWILDPDEDDNLYWKEWLQKNPHHVHKINEARTILLKLPRIDYQFSKRDKHNLWQSILQDSQGEDKSEIKYSRKTIPFYTTKSIKQEKKEKSRVGAKFNFYWRVAAGISILLIFSFLIWDKISFKDGKEDLPVEQIVKKNPLGQKSTIFLGDGSEVILNSGSAITFNDDFGKKDRILHLEGEAFFKVAKNEHQPFKVIANGLTTTALGTSFNVKAFNETTKVALVSGKVLVEKNKNYKNGSDTLMLIPGEQAVFSEQDTALIKNTFDLIQETGWKDGIIFFKDAKSEDVFAYLEKWYGVEIIEVNRSAKKWNYSGEFKNMSLHTVLKSIGFTMKFEFSMEDKHVKIEYLK